jgi:hypothetical protein
MKKTNSRHTGENFEDLVRDAKISIIADAMEGLNGRRIDGRS